MNVYTAGKDKQLLHDLECMGLVKAEEAQKLETKAKELGDAYMKEIERLEGQIEAANKILDEEIWDVTDRAAIKRLRVALLSREKKKENLPMKNYKTSRITV
jgi:hypothetical protein